LRQERTGEMNREDLPLKQERTNVMDEDLNVKTRLSSDALNITMLFSLNFALKGITPVKLCYFH
jgi:hypothetical protein